MEHPCEGERIPPCEHKAFKHIQVTIATTPHLSGSRPTGGSGWGGLAHCLWDGQQAVLSSTQTPPFDRVSGLCVLQEALDLRKTASFHGLQQWLVSSFTAWETAQLGDVRSQRLRHACHPPIGSGSPGEAALHKAQSGQVPLGNILLLMCSISYPSKLHVVTCRRISAQHSMWHRDRKSLASA